MNLPSSTTSTATDQFAPRLSPFEIPLPTDAGTALSAVLALGSDAELSQLLSLSEKRLGSAAGLFRALRLKHPVTANHCMRVAMGSSHFASCLNVDAVTREQIELAALLHDIGKLAIPDLLLNKVEPLTQSEQAVMDRHLQLAVHIIEPFCDDQMVSDIIRYSGHWFDGRHDEEIIGEAIPFGSRVLAIQNAFDSMTTDMVYRPAYGKGKVLAELCQHAGTQFDPELVATFVELQGDEDIQYYTDAIRNWVELAQGHVDSVWTLAAPACAGVEDAQAVFQKRLLESMHDGVVFLDLSGRIIIWNRGAADLTGLSREGIHYKQWEPQVTDMRDMEGNAIKIQHCPVRKCLQDSSELTQRVTITNRTTGQRVAVNLHLMPVHDAKSTCHGAIMIMHDVSPEYSLEETVQSLHNKATTDALTGVNNRAEFDRRHAELTASHLQSGEPLSLIICDIDRFKLINDTYGHQAGDDALIDFAQHICSHSREDDIVARYGGEEFILICPNCDSRSAVKKAEGIRKTLASILQPSLGGSTMTASFGVAELRPKETAEQMLKRADAALYQAKESGRNRVILSGATVAKASSSNGRVDPWKWFTKKGTSCELLIEHELKSMVPIEILAEKIRGFIDDTKATVDSSTLHKVVLLLDEQAFAGHRRQGERPISLTMEVELQDAPDGSTRIDVSIYYRRGRERRVDEVAERAQWLLKHFRGYMVAEDA